MGKFIEPKLELKINSEHFDEVQIGEHEEDKVILQQFEGEPDTVYLILNGVQVTIPLETLKASVETLHTLATIEKSQKKAVVGADKND